MKNSNNYAGDKHTYETQAYGSNFLKSQDYADKQVLFREARYLDAEIIWAPPYITITAPTGKIWCSSNLKTISAHTEPSYIREAITELLGQMAEGLTNALGTDHETYCECDLCESGASQQELDYTSLDYAEPENDES